MKRFTRAALIISLIASVACSARPDTQRAASAEDVVGVSARREEPVRATPGRAEPVRDARVFVLCDSVLNTAKRELRAHLQGFDLTIDCRVGRRLTQGIPILRARRAEIGGTVVVEMGNNYIPGEGGTFRHQIEMVMRMLRGVDRVVWMTVAEKWPSRVQINREIRAAARRWPSIRIAEWAPVIAENPRFSFDMLHLTDRGKAPIARVVARAVTAP